MDSDVEVKAATVSLGEAEFVTKSSKELFCGDRITVFISHIDLLFEIQNFKVVSICASACVISFCFV